MNVVLNATGDDWLAIQVGQNSRRGNDAILHAMRGRAGTTAGLSWRKSNTQESSRGIVAWMQDVQTFGLIQPFQG
jgi:hypothetical protein